MSQESGKSSISRSHQNGEQDVPSKPDGIDLKRAYMALIKGYIVTQMKKRAHNNADSGTELTDEVDAKGMHE